MTELDEIVSSSAPRYTRHHDTFETQHSQDSVYYRDKYSMFEQEFAKLAERENEIEEEPISKQKTKPIQKKVLKKKVVTKKVAPKTVPTYLGRFEVADTQKGNALGQQLDPINVFKWKKSAKPLRKKSMENHEMFYDQHECKNWLFIVPS